MARVGDGIPEMVSASRSASNLRLLSVDQEFMKYL